MPRARDLHRHEIANRESCDKLAAASDDSNAPPQQTSTAHIHPSGKLSELLASDDSQGHDSNVWQISDDWPEFVPITLGEVEVIEAFLWNALDELLK